MDKLERWRKEENRKEKKKVLKTRRDIILKMIEDKDQKELGGIMNNKRICKKCNEPVAVKDIGTQVIKFDYCWQHK